MSPGTLPEGLAPRTPPSPRRAKARLRPLRLRAFFVAQADPFLAGCGFALGLGWLWFAGLGELWREGTAGFLDIRAHEGLLALSFGAGCLVFGFAAGVLGNHRGLRLRIPIASVMAHGGALLCLGLLCAADLTPATGVALAGLAEAALGVYWLSRILLLEAARAVAALAWASLSSLCLAGLTFVLPPGSGIVFGLAACVLAAWILSFVLKARAVRDAGDEDGAAKPEAPAHLTTHLDGQQAGSAWGKRGGAWCAALGLAFFSLGAMYVLPMNYRGGPFALLAAHLAGAALAVPVLSPVFRTSSSNFPIFTDNGLRPVLFTAIGALCCAGFCSFAFPSFAQLALEPASAFLEAAGLGSFAALASRSSFAARQAHSDGIPRLAGLFLAALSLAVNAGHAVGREIMRTHGASGTALFLAALILLLALIVVTRAAKRQGMAAGDVPAIPAKLREEIAESFTTKEQAVAALLTQGHTNKKVAECLSVTEDAVRRHVKSLNKKTGAMDRRQLLDMLTRGGMSS